MGSVGLAFVIIIGELFYSIGAGICWADTRDYTSFGELMLTQFFVTYVWIIIPGIYSLGVFILVCYKIISEKGKIDSQFSRISQENSRKLEEKNIYLLAKNGGGSDGSDGSDDYYNLRSECNNSRVGGFKNRLAQSRVARFFRPRDRVFYYSSSARKIYTGVLRISLYAIALTIYTVISLYNAIRINKAIMGVDQSEDSLKTLRSSYMFYAYSGLIYVFVFIFDPAIQAAFREVKWSIGFSFGNVAKRLCFWKKERIFADLDDNCDFTPAVPDNRLTDIDQVINLYEVLSNEPQMDSTFLLRARKMQNNLNEEYLSDSFKTKGPTFSFL